MTDRDLLELAAKAVGHSVRKDLTYADGIIINNGYIWNPLTDDGDALRLAVKLKLTVLDGCARDGDGQIYFGDESDDPYAATRRAIVRAAAEIGKEKP